MGRNPGGRGSGRGAPRQPLSQRRPKAARKAAAAKGGRDRQAQVAKDHRRLANSIPSNKARTRKGSRIAAAALPAHARLVYEALSALYPDAHCELDHQGAWQLLVATVLSAQCTDRRVNMVTPRLFATWPGPAELAAAPQEELEEVIRATGFFRNKARNLIAMAGAIADRFTGRVPGTMGELVQLPGVGRKTANVVLGNALGMNEGVVVDTHVQRLSARLGLTRETDPARIELVLMSLFPREHWTMLSHLLIWHGRRVCDARRPKCEQCVLARTCPSAIA